MNDVRTRATLEADAAQLKALGYTSKFDRTMSKLENFALGFTYLSPVVGVYSLFGFALAAGGPPMFWWYLLVGIGQMFVCLVFGEVVSQFPISGGLYPWSRRLVGKRWAWMAGWVYGCALIVTIAAVATGGAPFLAQLLGFTAEPATTTTVALCMIAVATVCNVSGTRLLARVAMFGFVCELIGAIAVGAWLLLFHRHHPFSALFDTFGVSHGGSYLPAFLASALAAMFCYYGFEACGDVAEETPDASRMIPKAMRMTIYVGGAAAMLVCLALLLAVPDMRSVLAGKDPDPVASVLRAAGGELGFRAVIVVVLVSFISCLISIQAAASRLLFAYARDEMIAGSQFFSRISPRTHVPVAALLTGALLAATIALCGLWLQNAVSTIISFASAGIYLAFQMVVLAALVARARGWQPAGPFTLRRWGWPVNVVALGYGVFAIIDMVWPRNPQDPWYSNYGMIVTTTGVIALGALYMVAAKPYDRGQAPAGDAPLLHR
ncbi:MAG TPA: amino acid permease [Steroidobacteraceae bacterium]|nr:amino acid permease [Steroidobacteraceae bacterium]